MMSLSRLLFKKYLNFLLFTLERKLLFTSAFSKTHSFVFHVVHDILKTSFNPFISKTFSRRSSLFFRVHLSQLRVALGNRIFVGIVML